MASHGVFSVAYISNLRGLTGHNVPYFQDLTGHDAPHRHDIYSDGSCIQDQRVAGLDDNQFRADGCRRNRLNPESSMTFLGESGEEGADAFPSHMVALQLRQIGIGVMPNGIFAKRCAEAVMSVVSSRSRTAMAGCVSVIPIHPAKIHGISRSRLLHLHSMSSQQTGTITTARKLRCIEADQKWRLLPVRTLRVRSRPLLHCITGSNYSRGNEKVGSAGPSIISPYWWQ